MKKTKKIQLVLISAALASCNREFVPVQSPCHHIADSTLIASVVYDTDSDRINCIPCYQAYPQLWNYSIDPFGYYYNIVPTGIFYYPGTIYRKGVVWHGKQVIVRGGWGKCGRSGSASS